jgi:hypothetical protein
MWGSGGWILPTVLYAPRFVGAGSNLSLAASTVNGIAPCHSKHRIQQCLERPWSSPSLRRDTHPGGRPEHYLQGRFFGREARRDLHQPVAIDTRLLREAAIVAPSWGSQGKATEPREQGKPPHCARPRSRRRDIRRTRRAERVRSAQALKGARSMHARIACR